MGKSMWMRWTIASVVFSLSPMLCMAQERQEEELSYTDLLSLLDFDHAKSIPPSKEMAPKKNREQERSPSAAQKNTPTAAKKPERQTSTKATASMPLQLVPEEIESDMVSQNEASNSTTPEKKVAYTNEKAPTPAPHKRWLVDLEFLYWKINKGNAWYALKRNQVPLISNSSQLAGLLGKMERPLMDFAPGGRGSIGYRFDRDLWELTAGYTYYHASKTHHINVHYPGNNDQIDVSPVAIVPAWPHSLHGHPDDAVSKSKYRYMIEDLRLTRKFALTPHIDLRLFFGAQGAQIYQKWHVDFSFGPDRPDNVFRNLVTRNKLDWSFKGLGGNLGFDTTWHFWKGLGLLAKASFSALYGIHTTRVLGESNEPHFFDPSVFEPIADSKAIEHRPIYAGQYAFGLSWDGEFKRANVKLALSYESISWQNLNGDIFTQAYSSGAVAFAPYAQHAPIVDDTPFNLSGLTASLGLEF